MAVETPSSIETGNVFTLWPLLDYRSSPSDGFRNLSILGPIFKFQKLNENETVAVRPLFFSETDPREKTRETLYLYPIASSRSTPETSGFQALKLLQKETYRRDPDQPPAERFMLFPFYISGVSKRYGPYRSFFPIYGDLYERFWKDEYHFLLFPLYGRTVNKGTTTNNYLYPFFATISGEKESGFQIWPLYGQAAKEGVYSRKFWLWPLFLREESGLDTDNPVSRTLALPFYARTESARESSRYYFWPFFGHRASKEGDMEEWDYLWPLVRTAHGDRRNLVSFLPLYMRDERPESSKSWYMWPIYKHEEILSPQYEQQRDRVVYFLYSDNRERWPSDGATRRRIALWPLLLYGRDHDGTSSLSMPALVEPILDREGIEKLWAPLWRVYQHKWNERGDSAASVLWNLYWHERRGKDLAYEFFPFIEYRSESVNSDIKLLKGLIRYRNESGRRSVNMLWIPYGPSWGSDVQASVSAGSTH